MFYLVYIIPALIILLYILFVKKNERALREHVGFRIPEDPAPRKSVDVLIPFRDEGLHIPYLLKDLQRQQMSASEVRFVFINDHSTDRGVSFIEEIASQDKRFCCLHLEREEGKKAALELGLNSSQADLIVSIDADVRLGEHWLQTIIWFYHLEEPAMIIMPVDMQIPPKEIYTLLRVEWLGIMALTASSAIRNKALLANGANLAFERKALVELGGFARYQHISSGDDMFALAAMKLLGAHAVKYLFHENVIALTNAPNSFGALFRQRIRWASKSFRIQDPHIFGTGVLFACVQLLFLIGWFAAIRVDWMIFEIMFLFGLKLIVDYSFTSAMAKRLNTTFKERDLAIVMLIYPIYFFFIPLIGVFYKPQWKGRTIRI